MSSKTRKQRGRGGKMGKLAVGTAVAAGLAYQDHHRFSQGPSSGVVSENVNEFGIGRVGEDLGNTPPDTYAGEWEQWDKNSRNEQTGTKKKKNKKKQKTKKKKKDKKKKPPRNKDVGPEVNRRYNKKWHERQNEEEREGNKAAQQALMLGAAGVATATGALVYRHQKAAAAAARVEADRVKAENEEETARWTEVLRKRRVKEEKEKADIKAWRLRVEAAARVEAARVEAARVRRLREEAAAERRAEDAMDKQRKEGVRKSGIEAEEKRKKKKKKKDEERLNSGQYTHKDPTKFDPNPGKKKKKKKQKQKQCATGANGQTCGNHGTPAGTYTGTNTSSCSCNCRDDFTGTNCTTPPQPVPHGPQFSDEVVEAFDTLGVPPEHRNNTDEARTAVKKAYRKMALKYHPDRNRGNEVWAAEMIGNVNRAFNTIMVRVFNETTNKGGGKTRRKRKGQHGHGGKRRRKTRKQKSRRKRKTRKKKRKTRKR